MNALLILSICSPLIPVFIGIKQKTFTLLWVYPVTGFISDILITTLRRVVHAPNFLWPANIFIITEFLLISFLYRQKIFRNNIAFYFFIISLCALFIGHSIYTHSEWTFDMVGAGFFSVVYILYGILGLYSILKKAEVVYFERQWFFWLCVALLMYASGDFFIFLFKEYMFVVNKKLYLVIWNNVFLTLNIVKNLLIGVALSKNRTSE